MTTKIRYDYDLLQKFCSDNKDTNMKFGYIVQKEKN